MERRSSNTKRARHRGGTGLDIPLVPPGGFENSPRGEIGDAGVDGPNPPASPQTRNGAAIATPSYSLVPPGGLNVDTRFRRAVLYPLSYGGMLY